MDSAEDLHRLLSEQRRELTAAEAMDSDLDFAFRLQLQEAIAASLASHPSSSSSSSSASTLLNLQHHQQQQPPLPDDSIFNPTALQLEELSRAEQEIKDREMIEAETRKMREDLCRRIHDQQVATEIVRIPDEEWEEWGDEFMKPFGEGSSGSKAPVGLNESADFRVYFKGLVSEERVNGEKVVLAGIGVAICDPLGNLILEVSKPLVGNGLSKVAADAKALIEGFNAAIALDLSRVDFYCDYFPLFQFVYDDGPACEGFSVGELVRQVSGKWPVKQRKIAMLINQVKLLRRKFTYCSAVLVARQDIKFAFKLAKDAIVSQFTRPAESGSGKNVYETCVICLEDTDMSHLFSVDGCQHRYCFSCMKQHVEVKLLHGMEPKCPHEGCNSVLLVDSCRKFLPHKLVETMQQRKLEASIPVTEKIYCPYPRCSALMSKTEVLEYSKGLIGDSEQSGPKKCIKCHGLFCFSCKVPWHSGLTCSVYKRLNPNPPAEDVKLKFLATMSLWRQCVKCNHMIELAEGCYHMTCRCGYEFCYNCGAEWRNKKATCSCPLWVEDNIWFEGNNSDEEEEDDDDYDSDFF